MASEDEQTRLLSESQSSLRESTSRASIFASAHTQASLPEQIDRFCYDQKIMVVPENTWETDGQGRGTTPVGVSPVISETNDAITVRRPMQYYSIGNDEGRHHDERTRAAVQRYKYYSKLASNADMSLLMPNHVVPPEYFLVLPIHVEEGTQSSIVTIFSIWNTMMGTSILSMPWALEKAGFATGLSIMVLFAFMTVYTAYRVIKAPQLAGYTRVTCEFTDVCGYYLGKYGEYISVAFSLASLTGAAIVYWVLMTNFLYHSVTFVYEDVNGGFDNDTVVVIKNKTIIDAICPGSKGPAPIGPNSTHTGDGVPMFYKVWTQTLSVPFFLLVILGPLINIKSPTFFTKFNALGTVAVAYIVAFVSYKAGRWGINVNFHDPAQITYIPQFQWTFPALSGILALAFFIHNCILSIVKNQKNPENNGRDISIAFFLVLLTYLFIGSIFYLTFPLPKNCIADNLLNNFATDDIMAFVARIFLFFQMITVFPLLCYIFRIQVLRTLFGSDYPGLPHVLVTNACLATLCLIFAIFLPQIGTIIRFSGALCGLVYIFSLPCLVYLLSLRARGLPIAWYQYVIHISIIVVGLANLVAQFIIIGT